MDRGNKLWEGHRLLIPELREKATVTCSQCVFLTEVEGREETRTGCLVIMEEYGSLSKRVPLRIHAAEIILRAGRDTLTRALARGSRPDAMGCGLFRPRNRSK